MVLRFVHCHLMNSLLICSLFSAQLISESSLFLAAGPLASSVVELRQISNTKSCGDGSGAERSARVRAEKVQVIWMEELQSVPELLPPIYSAL